MPDTSAGSHELATKAPHIVKTTDPTGTAPRAEHLAFELLAAIYDEITKRETAQG